MTGGRPNRGSIALLAAVAVSVGSAAGCAGESSNAPRDRVSERRWVLPTARPDSSTLGGAAKSPLGLKWNWAQEATLGFAQESGGGATFFETEWCAVEPEPGKRQWARVDDVVARSQTMGYVMLLKIRTGSCWATQTGTSGGVGVLDPFANVDHKTTSRPPRDVAAYGAFVRDFVTRFSARGVHLYAVENEVDTANFWSADYGAYQDLVRTASAAIHEADPKATVLDAGVSSTSYGVAIAADLLDDGRDEEALEFYSAYYARRQAGDASRFPAVSDVAALRDVVDSRAGRRSREALAATFDLARSGAIDAYQLHFYEPWQLLAPVLEWVRGSLPASMPVEGWEVGVAWPGPSYDAEEQARETAKLLGTLLAGGVTRAVYLPLAYTPGAGRKEIFRGLLEEDGTPLPAASAYRSVMVASDGSRAVSAAALNGVSGVAFDRGPEATFVLWSEQPVRLRIAPPDQASATDLQGRQQDWPRGGLELGSDPVVLTWPAPLPTARATLRGSIRHG